jgi:anti-sigma regulatory factor (Ser/Thr protein kinase)
MTDRSIASDHAAHAAYLVPPDGGGCWAEAIPLAPPEAQNVTIDLSDVGLVTPLLAARLAAAIALQTAAGAEVHVTYPLAQEAKRSLLRLGVAAHLPHSSPDRLTPQESASDAVLAPLERICQAAEVEPFAERLLERMHTRLQGPLADSASAVMLALSELCDNAITHGESSHGVFVACQHKGDSCLTLVVGDLGVGIAEHLGAMLGDLSEDSRIFRAAMQRGTTGVSDDPTRGFGLPSVLDKLQRACVASSTLRIWSGRNRLEALLEPGQAPRIAPPGRSQHTAGTWVEVVLRAEPYAHQPVGAGIPGAASADRWSK